MISNSCVLILGIIAEKPLNPYEIKKLLGKISIKKWLPMAASSVYATIRVLCKKCYISGEITKEGNMPEKTIYTITEKGKEALHEALIEYLGSTELDKKEFSISSLLICHLDKEEAIEILHRKLKKLEKAANTQENMIAGFQKNKTIPHIGIAVIKHELNVVRAEMLSIRDFLVTINEDQDWNHFMARDLGDL